MISVFIILAIILWASVFVGIRAALAGYDPMDIAVLRFIVSSVALLLAAIPYKIRLPDRPDRLSFALLGLVLFVNMISLNYGMRSITAGETTLIISSSQLFQVLLAWLFLKERISARFITGLIFCFSGIAVIAFQNATGFSLNIGIFLVLLAAITNAVFFVLQKPLLKKYKPQEVNSYAIWIATLAMLPLGRHIIEASSMAPTGSTVTVVYIGMAALAASLCWSKALVKIPASRAAIYLYAVPVMTIVLGFLWLNELPSTISCIGGAVILTGVIISNLDSHGSVALGVGPR